MNDQIDVQEKDPAQIPTRPEMGDFAGMAQFVHECAGLVKVHAELAQQYAEIGDPVGLTYATRCLVAYTKAVGSTVKVMNETRKRREMRDERS